MREYNEIAEEVISILLTCASKRDLVAYYSAFEIVAEILGFKLNNIEEYIDAKENASNYEALMLYIGSKNRLAEICREEKPELDSRKHNNLEEFTIDLLHNRRLLQLDLRIADDEEHTLNQMTTSAYALREFYKLMGISFSLEVIPQILEAVYQDKSACFE